MSLLATLWIHFAIIAAPLGLWRKLGGLLVLKMCEGRLLLLDGEGGRRNE